MADIQIPQLSIMLDAQRDLSDLLMVRDITDGFDRQITHERVLNPFKVAASYDFATSTTLSVGDFGVGGKLVNLMSLPTEYTDIGMSNSMTALETGFYQGQAGVGNTNDFPTKIAPAALYGVINLQAPNPNNTTQVTFGQQAAGIAPDGSITNFRMFVKSMGDAGGEMTVAYQEETYTRTEIDNQIKNLIDTVIYPVGSVYHDTESTAGGNKPKVILDSYGIANEWTAIEGQTVVGYAAGDAEFGSISSSVGNKVTTNAAALDLSMNIGSLLVNNHSLLEGQMPVHVHDAGGLTIATGGAHTHGFGTGQIVATGTQNFTFTGIDPENDLNVVDQNGTLGNITNTNTTGSTHTHNISGNTGLKGGGAGHAHDLTGTQTGTVNVNNISIIQPSFIARIWRRTA